MLNVEIYTTSCEVCSFELCAIIHEDPPENAESKHYALQELDYCLLCNVDYRHCLHPLGEDVDSYEEKPETSRGPRQHTHDVDSPNCEGSREIDGPEGVGVFCSLLLEEFAFFALGDYFHRVIHSCRPIESVLECLVDDRVP
jgi:hypothetical protein